MRNRRPPLSVGLSRVRPRAALHGKGKGSGYEEHRQMWFYVQMWYPLLTIALTAAICLSVVSFIRGQAKPHP
jgi:hypothetical protein